MDCCHPDKLLNNELITEEFDGIIICTGRNSSPTYPHITGIETFQGKKIHSCDYRNNEPYSGKTVLLIGARHSACDLSRELAQVAKKVFLSHRRKTPLIINNAKIFQKPEVSKVKSGTVYFKDGTSEIVDSIIFCTGYDCILPQLDPSCEIDTAGNDIFRTLYKKFINPYHPTMSILGTYRHVALFKLIDIHAEIFIKIITNQFTLPSQDEMLSEIKRDQDERLKEHFIGDKNDHFGFASRQNFIDICRFGNCKPVPPVILDIFEKNRETVINDFDNYKNYEFEIIDDNTFKYRYLEKN